MWENQVSTDGQPSDSAAKNASLRTVGFPTSNPASTRGFLNHGLKSRATLKAVALIRARPYSTE
jgi:hypothetical protein